MRERVSRNLSSERLINSFVAIGLVLAYLSVMQVLEIAGYIDTLLRVSEIADYGNAVNGLQLENSSGTVSKIAAAVDAHFPVVKEAAERGCDLLLVHHGLFWSGLQPITGALFQKLQRCSKAGLAIYSAHLPLDGHLDLGNSMLLGRALGPGVSWEPYFPYKGFPIGVRGIMETTLDDLLQRTRLATGFPVHVCRGGPSQVRQVGIVTGGAGSEVAAMKALGIDTFITGEGPHWSYTLAEELGVNLIYGGHYATETFGVKALAEHLSQKFQLPWEFIDHPTGL